MLTAQQIEILAMHCDGFSDQGIAELTASTQQTVNRHRLAALARLEGAGLPAPKRFDPPPQRRRPKQLSNRLVGLL